MTCAKRALANARSQLGTSIFSRSTLTRVFTNRAWNAVPTLDCSCKHALTQWHTITLSDSLFEFSGLCCSLLTFCSGHTGGFCNDRSWSLRPVGNFTAISVDVISDHLSQPTRVSDRSLVIRRECERGFTVDFSTIILFFNLGTYSVHDKSYLRHKSFLNTL